MTPVKPLYIDQKPYFLEAPRRAMKLLPPWFPSSRGRTSLQYQYAKRKKGAKGRRPLGLPLHVATGTTASLAMGTASPPWGGTSSSIYRTPLHHPQCISSQTRCLMQYIIYL
jgi:hypothetical protein